MTGKNQLLIMVAVISLFFWFVAAANPATNTATQSVTITVAEFAEMTVSGDTKPLIIRNAAAGYPRYGAANSTTILSWASKVHPIGAGSRKITVQLDTNPTTGIQLMAGIGDLSCGAGSSTGLQHLSDAAAEIYTGIRNEKCSGATINLGASLNQMVSSAPEARTLTWTLLEDQ